MLSPKFRNTSGNSSRSSRTSSIESFSGLYGASHRRPHWRKGTVYSDDLTNYAQPRRTEPQTDRLNRYCKLLSLSVEQMSQMARSFLSELNVGLNAHKSGLSQDFADGKQSMLVLDSYITSLPSGNETGLFYGFDVGSTEFRMIRTELLGQEPVDHITATSSNNSGLNFYMSNVKHYLRRFENDKIEAGGMPSGLPSGLEVSANLLKISQMRISMKQDGFAGYEKGMMDPDMTATEFFNHLAENLKCLMQIHGDVPGVDRVDNTVPSVPEIPSTEEPSETTAHSDRLGVGLTFSFPCRQQSLSHSKLLAWRKGFQTGRNTQDPVEGRDVGTLFQQAFAKQKLPVDLTAVLNDTVGVLIACDYLRPRITALPDIEDAEKKRIEESVEGSRCLISVVISNGFNACYVEPKSKEYNYVGKIINLELGNFGNFLPLTDVDVEIDFLSENPGSMKLEKLVSGLYLGEILRRTVVKTFQDRSPPTAWIEDSLVLEDVLDIVNDNTDSHVIVHKKLLSKWGVVWSQEDVDDLYALAIHVVDRSCVCTAVVIVALSIQMGKLTIEEESGASSRCSRCNGSGSCESEHMKVANRANTNECILVGMDGIITAKCPWTMRRLMFHIERLIGKDNAGLFEIIPTCDGSGIGAAILAATAAQ